MKLSARDQKILLVLLPALVLFGYWHFWLRELRQDMQQSQTRLLALGSAPQLQARLEQALARQHQLQQQLAELPVVAGLAAAAEQSDAPQSNNKLQQLQELLQQYQARLVSAAAIPPQRIERSERLDVVRQLERSGQTRPQHWQVVAEASYATMVKLLQHCAANSTAPVVESVVLPASYSADKPAYWSLVLCL